MKPITKYMNTPLLTTVALTTTTFTFGDFFLKSLSILVFFVGLLSHYTNIKIRVDEKFKGSWKKYFKFLKNNKYHNLLKKKKHGK